MAHQTIYVFDLLIARRKSVVWKLAHDYCLQDFFASSRPHRVHTNIFYRKVMLLFVLLKAKQYYRSKENH